MAKSATRKASNVFVWIIVLLLIIGLMGFGVGGFGGTIRSIGSVGDTEISTNRYANALQQELRNVRAQTGQPVTMAQAQSFGLDRAVLQQVVATTALENEARDLGLSVGDEAVRREVLRVPAFQGLDGNFDREAYEFSLRQNGQTVGQFEQSIRDETARTLLQGAVVAGATTPDVFLDTLYTFARETRDFSYVALRAGDLATPLGEPDDATLQAFHDENPDLFTLPERRAVTYAWLSPDMITDEVGVDDDALRRLYDDRIDEYVQPERRLVERLVFGTAEEAEAARAAIDAGETDFDGLVADRGLDLADIDLGDLSRAQLGGAADAVFALDGPGVAGPVETDLGPALIRVNGILAAQETTFEEVRDTLLDEYADSAARRLVGDRTERIDDLLAGGATLEELAADTDMGLDTILLGDENDEPIAGYQAFRAAADAAELGDFPNVLQLEDGGIFALRLDEIVPPELQPLDEVRVEVISAWEAAETAKALTAQAEAMVAEVDGGADFLSLTPEPLAVTDTLRDAFLEDTPDALVTAVFDMEPGVLRVVSDDSGAFIVRLDEVNAPDMTGPEATAIRQGFAEQTSQGYARDMIDAFTRSIEGQAGIQLNQTAIDAVNQQFP